ncbi:M23 family metallopeptidase [Kribbella sp. NPDC023855]|uniref:murein hydrolase activator EnvC family protein n=1 Tax=Kribbella sp. NPDC023855 TaxID=3154698 RepID=UPI0033E47F72
MTPFLLTPLTIALLNPLTPTPPPTPNPPTLHPLQAVTPAPTPLISPLDSAALASPPARVALASTPGRAAVTSAADPAAVWPLTPRPAIFRGFEPPPKPWLPGHRGLDLSGSPGQQVRSATPGTVTYAAPLAGRGVIVITNGPLRTTYEPVIPTIRVGATVTPGTPIGHLSAAGSHCAPATCLHWGLRQATTYLNPLSLLPHHPIRLLPLTPPRTSAPPWTPARPPDDPTGYKPARPSAAPDPGPPPASLQATAPPRGELTSGVLVSLAAAATLIGSLLIRRH